MWNIPLYQGGNLWPPVNPLWGQAGKCPQHFLDTPGWGLQAEQIISVRCWESHFHYYSREPVNSSWKCEFCEKCDFKIVNFDNVNVNLWMNCGFLPQCGQLQLWALVKQMRIMLHSFCIKIEGFNNMRKFPQPPTSSEIAIVFALSRITLPTHTWKKINFLSVYVAHAWSVNKWRWWKVFVHRKGRWLTN